MNECLAKMSYVARASQPDLSLTTLAKFDQRMLDALCDKNDLGALSAEELAEVLLPISLGGWGYKRQAEIAPFAWLAAQAQIAPILKGSRFRSSRQTAEQLQQILARARELIAESKQDNASLLAKLPDLGADPVDWFAEDTERADGLQAELTKLLTEKYVLVVNSGSKADKERIKSNATEEAAQFHTALPMSPNTTMQDTDYRTFAKLKLGRPAIQRDVGKQCGRCKRALSGEEDPSWHPIHCKSLVPIESNRRHAAAITLLHRFLTDLGIASATETRPPCSENKLRLDVTAQALHYYLIDVSIRSTKAPSRKAHPHLLFEQAERDKRTKYAGEAKSHNAEVVPFIMNEYGALSPAAKRFLSQIVEEAEQMGNIRGEKTAFELLRCFKRDLSITMASHTAHVAFVFANRMANENQRDEQQAELARKLVPELLSAASALSLSLSSSSTPLLLGPPLVSLSASSSLNAPMDTRMSPMPEASCESKRTVRAQTDEKEAKAAAGAAAPAPLGLAPLNLATSQNEIGQSASGASSGGLSSAGSKDSCNTSQSPSGSGDMSDASPIASSDGGAAAASAPALVSDVEMSSGSGSAPSPAALASGSSRNQLSPMMQDDDPQMS